MLVSLPLLLMIILLFDLTLSRVNRCAEAPLPVIRFPPDCLAIPPVLRNFPEAFSDKVYRFNPTPDPSQIYTYVPVPYIYKHSTCALVVYVDPNTEDDTSAWYKIAAELDDISATCSTQMTGRGGMGLIGRKGKLTVGMVSSFETIADGQGLYVENGTLSVEVLEWLSGHDTVERNDPLGTHAGRSTKDGEQVQER